MSVLVSSSWFRPWRSAQCTGAILGIALLVGVPVFLRMPPWCDLTLYDVAARSLLNGGVLYRDVFDTNLPGFVWALAAVRAVLGWSYEAVRAVDLLVVAGIVALLDRLAARAGASQPARTWAAAAVAAFYPFTSEFNHCQRDVWMRSGPRRRGPRPPAGRRRDHARLTGGRARRGAVGLAVWVKPHAAVPAASSCGWLTVPGSWACGRGRGRGHRSARQLLGGSLVGTAGVGLLAASGAWPYFVEVFTFWNTGYAAEMWAELPVRCEFAQLPLFPPWSYLQS